jgi:HlyD family secretion protein
MKSLKKILILLLLVGIAVAGYMYYKQTHKLKPEDLYRLEEITRGNIEQTVAANGTLNPVSLISVGTQVSGIVKKMYVDFNDVVKKDQVLMELDSRLFNAQIAQSQGNVRNNEAALALAIANEKRMHELYAQEYVSRQEWDTAVQVMKSAKAQLETARGALARDVTNLSFSVIRSPVSGVVVNRVVDVGQTVAASFQTPTLIQIAQDLSKMQIDTSFAEADIGKIKEGQKVTFNVDAFPDRNFEGVVKQLRLNSTNTSNVVTYNAVVTVYNSDLTLLPGMTAYVNIIVDRARHALLVPNAALRYKPKLSESAEQDQKQKMDSKEDRKNWKDRAGKGEMADKSGRGNANTGGSGRRQGHSHGHDGLAAGKIYVLRAGQPVMVRVHLGMTDGRSTVVTGEGLSVGDKVIVSELQADNQGKPSGGNNGPRGPRMF